MYIEKDDLGLVQSVKFRIIPVERKECWKSAYTFIKKNLLVSMKVKNL